MEANETKLRRKYQQLPEFQVDSVNIKGSMYQDFEKLYQ
jgi:hypothetical protein